MVMQRSSTGLGLETLHKSESKSSLSDSSTKGSTLKVGTTLQPPQVAPHTIVSPVAESPAREAEASRPSPLVGPSPLGAIPGSRPQEPPAPSTIPSEPPAPRPQEPPAPVPVIPSELPAPRPQEPPAPVPIIPSEPPAPRLPEPGLQVVESPPNLVDSPQAHESALPVVEQVSGKLSDVIAPQPTVAKTPDITSREVREEPSSVRPQAESGFDSINKGYGIPAVRAEEPEPKPVLMPTPQPAPAVIQVPEQQVPPPTQVVSDVRELPLLGPTVVAVPPEDHSPWASVITRNDNLSSQPRTPPNLPRSLSPKQSRASLAGTVFESVNGSQQSLPRQISNKPSQQSLPRQISNKPSKTSLAPSYTWSSKVDPQPKPTPQVVDHTNGDARTLSSAR